ncbi:hypothetical protein LIER_22109 [Lithospermum erythrorhizon]|uniref:Reverse transcriptase n=1 Tax=Lithospermum erythrorhizon TaxID=34254 RepID=A0AAV3QU70_LITER
MFAYDTLLLGTVSVEEATTIKGILNTYESWSGQLVSSQKYTIMFSPNVEEHTRREISGTLGMPVVDNHGKYLGLPSTIGPSKKEVFNSIIDRVEIKVDNWKSRLLSKEGAKPSYTWRSLLSVRNLVYQGIKWQLGNGEDINSWKHEWVKHTSRNKVITPMVEEFSNLKVANLIDKNIGVWNINRVRTLFYQGIE